MSQTYGEVLSSSYEEIFQLAGERSCETVFVDAGSGDGLLVQGAAAQFAYSVGIEKFRDRYLTSLELGLDPAQARFVLEDINDTDFVGLFHQHRSHSDSAKETGSDASAASMSGGTMCIHCNNVAFGQGLNIRSGVKFRAVMDELALTGTRTIVVSAMPLPALADRLDRTLDLDMSWTSNKHTAMVYAHPADLSTLCSKPVSVLSLCASPAIQTPWVLQGQYAVAAVCMAALLVAAGAALTRRSLVT